MACLGMLGAATRVVEYIYYEDRVVLVMSLLVQTLFLLDIAYNHSRRLIAVLIRSHLTST